MLTNNEATKRCLILSRYSDIRTLLTPLCEEFNLIPDFIFDRKSALNYFLQYKHSFIVIDAQFLPRFAFRLVQIFKIAHRQPAVLILNSSGNNLAGFEWLEGYYIRVVEHPFTADGIRNAISEAINQTNRIVRAVFVKNLLVQSGIAVPLIMLLLYLLTRGHSLP